MDQPALDAEPRSIAADVRRPNWRMALLGLGLTVGGPASYFAMLGVPWSRSTGAPAIALMVAGCIAGLIAAMRTSRLSVRLMSGFNFALLAMFLVGLFGLLRLPTGGIGRQLTEARDFTLPDQDGNPVTLRSELKKGPVLLVFYRGFW